MIINVKTTRFHENQREAMIINENPWESIGIKGHGNESMWTLEDQGWSLRANEVHGEALRTNYHDIQRESIGINGNEYEPMRIHEDQWGSRQCKEIHWESAGTYNNQLESMRCNEKLWEPKRLTYNTNLSFAMGFIQMFAGRGGTYTEFCALGLDLYISGNLQ